MPRIYTAQAIKQIVNMWPTEDNGQLVGFKISCEVNYGDMSRLEELDIWGLLTAPQQAALQQVYSRAKALLIQRIVT